ncbi:MAG: LCP family protein [Actinomycetia bacterium]|nr:LCP family protein [Actinomycetes bacterium]
MLPISWRGRPRRTWPQRLIIAVNVVAVFGALVAASSITYVHAEIRVIPRIAMGESMTPVDELSEGSPVNVLIVGVDSAAGLDPDDDAHVNRDSNELTDTMMLVRADPVTDEVKILSFPRDLWVELADGNSSKLNAAVAFGGPPLLIETIRQEFAIDVNAYVAVDLAGFKALVDAIGGVDMWFDHPMRIKSADPRATEVPAKVLVPDAGCVAFDGSTALDYVRARVMEFKIDGRWRGPTLDDDAGDFGRTQRQQDFVRRLMGRAIDKGARNPVVLNDLIRVAQDNVTLDDSLSTRDLLDLGQQLRAFDPDGLGMHRIPTKYGREGSQSVLRISDEEAAEAIFALFRDPAPGTEITPSDTSTPSATTTATTPSASPATTVPSGPTTTVIGAVPGPPPEGVSCG